MGEAILHDRQCEWRGRAQRCQLVPLVVGYCPMTRYNTPPQPQQLSLTLNEATTVNRVMVRTSPCPPLCGGHSRILEFRLFPYGVPAYGRQRPHNEVEEFIFAIKAAFTPRASSAGALQFLYAEVDNADEQKLL